MSTIDCQQLAVFKDSLIAELDRLLNRTPTNMSPVIRVNFAEVNGDVVDNDDVAVVDKLSDLDNAIVGLRLQKVDDINGALERMHAGAYGLCVDCGEAINIERLKVYLTAKRCIQCQTQHEKTAVAY
ncbi:MAG: TraR/DksA C4-type zinc finger protein [Methylophilaceae bacterium]